MIFKKGQSTCRFITPIGQVIGVRLLIEDEQGPIAFQAMQMVSQNEMSQIKGRMGDSEGSPVYYSVDPNGIEIAPKPNKDVQIMVTYYPSPSTL